MPIIIEDICDSMSCTSYFNETPPISPSNVLFALLENNVKNSEIFPNDFIWHLSENETLQDMINTIAIVNWQLIYITSFSNIFQKIDRILFPNHAIKSIGCPGLMIYREEDVLYKRDIDFPGRKLYMSEIISHQVTRELFIGMVTGSWWTDLWLGESLSKLYSHYILDKISGDSQLMELYASQILQQTPHFEINCYMKSLSEYNMLDADKIDIDLCSRWYYNKGYALLYMIEHIVTRDKFQYAVRKYLNKFIFRSATLNDFWSTLQLVFDNGTYQEIRIEEIMDTWLTNRYYPIVQIFHDHHKNLLTYIITGSDNMMPSIWKVPITYETYSNSARHSNSSNILIINSSTGNIVVDKNITFAIFNIKHHGYYRVNYDKGTWLRIATFLNRGTHEIYALNRAQLIDDAYYFMTQGYLLSSIFWKIVKHLQFDKNYIVWYPMFNILSNMWPVLNHPNAEYMKTNVLEMLNGILQELEFKEKDEKDNMSKALRLLAARWACKLGHIKCRMAATSDLFLSFTDPVKNKFPAWWKDWIYCAGMMLGNEDLSQRLFEKYKNTTDVNYMKYLCCAEDIEVLMKNMADLLSLTPTQDKRLKLYRIITKKPHVVKHIMENYLKIDHSW
ncbi:Thyrotropin-releasing hormone-degrading ectoenzyme [Harpegnathos saltator]|uniref:Thyrotropin-releasing hormone-degrading ectoenzyme n=1 Tax=Harpegnathos saltator TaxID=610380 RepID=E2BGI1_HARSA|nr:Thyrotropin-releasing hormone-degrading ectoenzyme [Harpegnathos saltator]